MLIPSRHWRDESTWKPDSWFLVLASSNWRELLKIELEVWRLKIADICDPDPLFRRLRERDGERAIRRAGAPHLAASALHPHHRTNQNPQLAEAFATSARSMAAQVGSPTAAQSSAPQSPHASSSQPQPQLQPQGSIRTPRHTAAAPQSFSPTNAHVELGLRSRKVRPVGGRWAPSRRSLPPVATQIERRALMAPCLQPPRLRQTVTLQNPKRYQENSIFENAY